MSLSPAIIDAMVAAGASVEVLAAAMKADLVERSGQVAVKREKDAERQRQHRARNAVSRDVTVTNGDSVTGPPLSRPPNENISNPPTHTPVINTTRARGGDFPMLDCADPALWADFLKNRKAKRLPNTASAHRKLQSDLAQVSVRSGWPPGEVFAACVANGWGAIYETDEMKGKCNGRTNFRAGGNGGADKRDGLAKALDAIIAGEFRETH